MRVTECCGTVALIMIAISTVRKVRCASQVRNDGNGYAPLEPTSELRLC